MEEVHEKFKAQKDTHMRLVLLRETGEKDKHKLEQQIENMNLELENYKYAEAKDSDQLSQYHS